MNNCRAGLYSFASTTAWLHKIGVASPPLLVMLGLTLPDSRILSGIASIGLTLANIAIILPHLRQPILDSIHALENALAHEQSTKEQTNLFPDRPNATLEAERSVLAPVLPSEREHQSPPLTCSATLKSVRSADTEPLGYPDVEPEAAPQTMLLPPAEKTDDSQTFPQISHSPDVDSSDRHVSSNNLFTREGRGALYTPLPVPDVEEIAFFDTEDATLSINDPGEECPAAACERHTVPEGHHKIEYRGLKDGKGIDNDGQLVAANISSAQGLVEIGNSTDGTMVASGQRTMAEAVPPPPNAIVRDHYKPVAEGTISDPPHGLPTRGGAVQSAQAKYSSVAGKEAATKHRPESLEFIPQSVIRRYPSAGHCFGHRAFSPGHDYQFPLAPPHVFVNNPAMLLEGTWPRATYTTLEGPWRASFFTEIHPTRQFMGGQAFVIETAPVEQESTSLSKRPALHELSPLRKRPTHRRRLGVLARAALRDRRSTARRRRNDGNDGSSTSDSDSDFESDSEYSSGSSADESILPRILGADLIAAIDANSESDLNLVASRRTKRTPLNLYEDFLISEDSTADISMVMQVSSYDDASEVIAPASRSLTYEDIQQWASGVVQKCVRQVCRSRVHAEPSSPSQASDVCAERPSGSGVSQCPLSGLHCKLGAAALTEIPAPKTEELPVSLPPTSIQPSRKPLHVRNLRDIPEFVPRQGYVSMMTGRVEGPGRFNTGSTVDNARDAAARVIARMENQAGFNTRQWLVGTEEKRMVNTAGGRQGTLRCA